MSDTPKYPRFPRVHKKPDEHVHWFDWFLYQPTYRRIVWYVILVPLFFVTIRLTGADNLLWLLAYLFVVLLVIAETSVNRSMLIRNRNHRRAFDAWVDNLDKAPEPVKIYWLNLFDAVERMMLAFYPTLWQRMNEMQRWILVDVVEIGMQRRVAGVIEAYQEFLEKREQPALEPPNETMAYQQGQIRDNRPTNAHVRAFLDKTLHE